MLIRVTCAIIEKDGKVLAAQRSASMSLPMKWEFPGGKFHDGEDAESCIRREIMEELAIELDLIRKLPVHSHAYGEKIIELTPFVCSVATGELQIREHNAIKWCSKDELQQLDWAEADIGVLNSYLQNGTK